MLSETTAEVCRELQFVASDQMLDFLADQAMEVMKPMTSLQIRISKLDEANEPRNILWKQIARCDGLVIKEKDPELKAGYIEELRLLHQQLDKMDKGNVGRCALNAELSDLSMTANVLNHGLSGFAEQTLRAQSNADDSFRGSSYLGGCPVM